MRRIVVFSLTIFFAAGIAASVSFLVTPAARSATYYQIVDNSNSNRFKASSRWAVSNYHSNTDYGKNYRVLKKPLSVSENAKFKIKTPAKGSYRVMARWPSDSGYNNRTRFFVKTPGGWKGKVVNQRKNGGKWIYLGTYKLAAGDSYRIQVSSKSAGTGYIIADAVKIRRVTTSTTTSSGYTGYDVVKEAKTWLGVPYSYGGTSKQGVDCSGLSMMVYKKFGKTLPHNAHDQYYSSVGTKVSKSSLRRGFLIFGHADGGSGIEHVGILTGDGRMIHAPQPGTVVRYDDIPASWYNIVGVKRIFPAS